MDTRTDTVYVNLRANIRPVHTVAVTFDLSATDRYRRAVADIAAAYRRTRALHTQPAYDRHAHYTDNTIARAVSRHLDGTGDLTDRSIAASLGPDEYRAWVRSVDTCRRALHTA